MTFRMKILCKNSQGRWDWKATQRDYPDSTSPREAIKATGLAEPEGVAYIQEMPKGEVIKYDIDKGGRLRENKSHCIVSL